MPWLLLSLLLAPSPASDLRGRVQKLIDGSGAEVAVVLRTLDGKDELLIDPDKAFHAASTMKVPVMIELYRQAEAGQHIGAMPDVIGRLGAGRDCVMRFIHS